MSKEYQQQYYQKNKARMRAQNKEWAKNNPKSTKSSKIKYKYGISLDEYETRFKQQGEICGICRTTIQLGKLTHLDHCHSTGRLRDFLCEKCNIGLGVFKENIDFLRSAIGYLEKHGTSKIQH